MLSTNFGASVVNSGKTKVLVVDYDPEIEELFVDVLERQAPDQRYYLSPNAAQGIIRRVDRMGRRLFEPLDVTLRLLAVSVPSRAELKELAPERFAA